MRPRNNDGGLRGDEDGDGEHSDSQNDGEHETSRFRRFHCAQRARWVGWLVDALSVCLGTGGNAGSGTICREARRLCARWRVKKSRRVREFARRCVGPSCAPGRFGVVLGMASKTPGVTISKGRPRTRRCWVCREEKALATYRHAGRSSGGRVCEACREGGRHRAFEASCLVCKKRFEARSKKARICSDACRTQRELAQAAARRRKTRRAIARKRRKTL